MIHRLMFVFVASFILWPALAQSQTAGGEYEGPTLSSPSLSSGGVEEGVLGSPRLRQMEEEGPIELQKFRTPDSENEVGIAPSSPTSPEVSSVGGGSIDNQNPPPPVSPKFPGNAQINKQGGVPID